MERRRHPRYSCILQATLESGEKQEFQPMRMARVLNVSQSGLCIHGVEDFWPGTRLALKLKTPIQEFGPIEVVIMHTTEQPDGTFIMGGEFSQELSEHLLRAILAD